MWILVVGGQVHMGTHGDGKGMCYMLLRSRMWSLA